MRLILDWLDDDNIVQYLATTQMSQNLTHLDCRWAHRVQGVRMDDSH